MSGQHTAGAKLKDVTQFSRVQAPSPPASSSDKSDMVGDMLSTVSRLRTPYSHPRQNSTCLGGSVDSGLEPTVFSLMRVSSVGNTSENEQDSWDVAKIEALDDVYKRHGLTPKGRYCLLELGCGTAEHLVSQVDHISTDRMHCIGIDVREDCDPIPERDNLTVQYGVDALVPQNVFVLLQTETDRGKMAAPEVDILQIIHPQKYLQTSETRSPLEVYQYDGYTRTVYTFMTSMVKNLAPLSEVRILLRTEFQYVSNKPNKRAAREEWEAIRKNMIDMMVLFDCHLKYADPIRSYTNGTYLRTAGHQGGGATVDDQDGRECLELVFVRCVTKEDSQDFFSVVGKKVKPKGKRYPRGVVCRLPG